MSSEFSSREQEERRRSSDDRDPAPSTGSTRSASLAAAQAAAGRAAVARIAGTAPSRGPTFAGAPGGAAGAAAGAGAAGEAAGEAVDKPIAAGDPSAGMGGMVTADLDGVTFSDKGKESKGTLTAGTAVAVLSVSDTTLRVRAYSGHGGAICDLPADKFRAEPGIAHQIGQHTDERMNDVSFAQLGGPLWNGAPKATDVNQGYLGDCYLISAMGAVAAANPSVIMSAFNPQTPNQASYNIRLYKKKLNADGTAKYVPQVYAVDANIPVYSGGSTPHYAGQLDGSMSGNATADAAAAKPIWFMLIEKAYAIHKGMSDTDGNYPSGDYGLVGDNGGPPKDVMAALTGEDAVNDSAPGTGDEVLRRFADFQKHKQAVVCATIDHKATSGVGGFAGSSEGPYQLSFKLNGEDGDLVQNTIHLTDKSKQVAEVTDDGTKLVGDDLDAAKSSVLYSPGKLTLQFVKGKQPKSADDLHLAADARGLLDADVRVHAWHAYMFESYDAATKLIQFRNPWGTDHPKPITAAQFLKYFSDFTYTQVPKAPGTH